MKVKKRKIFINKVKNLFPPSFSFSKNNLTSNGKLLSKIVDLYGSPLFLYSEKTILNATDSIQNITKNHPVTVCYAVKANPALSLIKLISNLNFGLIWFPLRN